MTESEGDLQDAVVKKNEIFKASEIKVNNAKQRSLLIQQPPLKKKRK